MSEVLGAVLYFDVVWNLSELHVSAPKASVTSFVPLQKSMAGELHHCKVTTGLENANPFLEASDRYYVSLPARSQRHLCCVSLDEGDLQIPELDQRFLGGKEPSLTPLVFS